MFKELMPVVADRPLTITVAALADGKIRVCVVPQSLEKDGKVNDKVGYHKEVTKIPDASIKALTTPLALTGTPDELDAELCEKLTTYAGSHAQLQHGIAQATQEITDALKAIDDRNKAKSKSKTVPPAKKADTEQKGKQPPAPEATLPLHWLAPSAAPAASAAVSADDEPTGDHERDEQEDEEEEVIANG
jgi:PRTRC genetic system protein E